MKSRWTFGLVTAVLGALVALAVERSGLFAEFSLQDVGKNVSQKSLLRDDAADSGKPADPFWLDPEDVVVEREEIHSRFSRLAEQAAPAVVNVHTSKTVVQRVPDFPFPDLFGDLFGGGLGRDQFRDGSPPAFRRPDQREYHVPSLGTGFIISTDGYILTNHHVIDDVDEIEVRFRNGDHAKAEVIGEDPKTDLALIQVKGVSDLHVLPLGDSDEILPGDWVVAIGNPFGLSHTVTVGIVSAKGRQIGQGPYDDFIQTDAAINPGNSGGPLLNLRGEVVGVNTAINPQANTIGFAVPSNMAKAILPQLREDGRVTRGWLGVGVQPVTRELQEAFDLPERRGALVAQVTPGSPADEAGLERGDVILRFDGSAVDEMRDLPALVAATPVGKTVEIEFNRSGKVRNVEVTVAKLQEESPGLARAGRTSVDAFGLRVEDLSPMIRERYRIEASVGVVVTQVDPAGAAAAAGIREGDVVLEVNREPIDDVSEFEAALGERDSALVLIERGETTLFLILQRGSDE
jgi:serine protease Do